MNKTRVERKKLRQARVRAKVRGTSEIPRLTVFKSNTNVYAQIIDDEKAQTIISFDSRKVKDGKLSEKATKVGEEIAKLANDKKIDKVVFDRAGYFYTGIVKNLADGARKGGLKF